jgi:hypothetical protein
VITLDHLSSLSKLLVLRLHPALALPDLGARKLGIPLLRISLARSRPGAGVLACARVAASGAATARARVLAHAVTLTGALCGLLARLLPCLAAKTLAGQLGGLDLELVGTGGVLKPLLGHLFGLLGRYLLALLTVELTGWLLVLLLLRGPVGLSLILSTLRQSEGGGQRNRDGGGCQRQAGSCEHKMLPFKYFWCAANRVAGSGGPAS